MKTTTTPSANQKRFIDCVRPEQSVNIEAMRERQRNRDVFKKSAHVAIELLNAMEERGLTRIELAKRMEVTVEEVDAWLKGKILIDEATLGKFERGLGVKIMAQ